MPSCRICLRSVTGDPAYHAACLTALFGTGNLPTIDIELNQLYGLAAEMAGKMSISGAQEKICLSLSSDGTNLKVASVGGMYILKPEPARYNFIPQNEHLTMCMASLAGIDVPPCGLVQLKDGAIAYLIKRFDRREDGTKLRLEDFCQLAERSSRDKYQGSAELCVRVLRKYASEPIVEIRKLFKVFLFSWWVSNGDQHLKNFSLLTAPDGRHRLSPAYDLLCTRLAIPTDLDLALTVQGKRSGLTRGTWMEFAAYCQLPEKAAWRLLDEQVQAFASSRELIHASLLPDDLKAKYEEILQENTAILTR
jgi:serine/threonine-protein kinase HipA